MSNTSINLKYPYNEKWRKGYLNINKDGRQTLTLYNNDKNRSSTQYARYLLAVKLGRFLTKNEQADHKDEDKTNDNINNLQILTKLEHIKKTRIKLKLKIFCICPICNATFKSTKQRLGKKTPTTKCCSRICGYTQATLTRK